MLEKMDDFFAQRVDGYDEHMKTNIRGADEFYSFTASLLPKISGAMVLDLGCGTGLELEEYFLLNGSAVITGIDLSISMLNALKKKFPDKNMTLIHNSYFDEPFGEAVFDAAVSVESLHHFTAEKKEKLYHKLHASLKKNGYFVLTDYFAESEASEQEYFENLKKIRRDQGISDDSFYHYDTPLTVEHETEALLNAGFSSVEIQKSWGATYTLIAYK
ncbi:MAG: class I SAM-dependent methyltransferase [Clostridiales bacterium]|nr:class I SAM-dependent methyltransferase [Clostridiales bacterium]